MRPVIVTAFVSTDGVMEEPRWTFEVVEYDEAAYEIKDREQKEASALLLGRRTYEEFAPVWPTMDEFAEYNAMPRYVVSTSMEQDNPEWPATILPTLEHVAALKETEGGPTCTGAQSSVPIWLTPASSTAITYWSSPCCSVPASAFSARARRS
jgi:dihydrofolate reductase